MKKENIYNGFNFYYENMGIDGIFLNLPYPPSNNRNARFGSKGIYKDKKTYDYLSTIKSAFSGDLKPLDCALNVSLSIYPNLPKDHVKRAKREGDFWWFNVRCLDLDNISKTVLDSLNGIAYIDDKQIVRLFIKKMCPDEKGSRLEVKISEFKL